MILMVFLIWFACQSKISARELTDERIQLRLDILEKNPNIDDVSIMVTLVTEEGTVIVVNYSSNFLIAIHNLTVADPGFLTLVAPTSKVGSQPIISLNCS